MFNAGRILSNRSTIQGNRRNPPAWLIFSNRHLRKSQKYPGRITASVRNLREKPIPFVWQALVSAIVGLAMIVAGALICVAGFRAEEQSDVWEYYFSEPVGETNDRVLGPKSTQKSGEATRGINKSSAYRGTNPTQDRHQSGKWLAFVGPITMSFGGFFIVFSFVVVCELREKLDHATTKREKSSKRFQFKSFDLLEELAQSRKRKEKQLLARRETICQIP